MRAILIDTDGFIHEGNLNGLRDYQRVVGGYIEGVDLIIPGTQGYVNEEGLIHQLEFNLVASTLAGRPIVGPLVIVGALDEEGNDTDVPEGTLALLREV